MSLENFAFYFPVREMFADPLSTVDLGLVVCQPGTDLVQVKDQLQTIVGKEIKVYTRKELVEKEIRFWDKNTPIGVIFRVGMIMGFVVGILICYQVLYNDIADHMAEFATLMAMGYSRGYFIGVVVREAIYLALFGFLPGLCISWLLFQLIDRLDRLDHDSVAVGYRTDPGLHRRHVCRVRSTGRAKTAGSRSCQPVLRQVWTMQRPVDSMTNDGGNDE